MQGLFRAVRCWQDIAVARPLKDEARANKVLTRLGCVTSSLLPSSSTHKGLENTTVADVLMTKGGDRVGPWFCCCSSDIVHDAAKKMAENNVGSLVVLKPGNKELIAGIFTERDYMKKIAADGRPAKFTRVGEIMTEEDKLLTVSSDTNILQAMQVMTENHLRHVPVIDGKIVGMISMEDVVRALVDQQGHDVKRLNEFIGGDYY